MTRRTLRPDMIVLEHDHAAEVVAVGIDSSYKHAVLLDKSETCEANKSAQCDRSEIGRRTRRRLASAGNDTLETSFARLDKHTT